MSDAAADVPAVLAADTPYVLAAAEAAPSILVLQDTCGNKFGNLHLDQMSILDRRIS